MKKTGDPHGRPRPSVESLSRHLNLSITPMLRPSHLLVLCLLGLSLGAHATQRAVTEKGDEVLLEDDGTWKYVKAPPSGSGTAQVGTNDTRYTRPVTATFPVRSTRNNAVEYIDPKKWRFKQADKGGDAEYTFQSVEGDLYGTLISERLAMPLDTLGDLALNNMRKVAPDAEVLKREYRYVNDKKVLYMRMNATIRGIKLVYSGCYYSDDNGTTQLLAVTSQNLVQAHGAAIEAFLDGIYFPTPTAPKEN